MPTILTFFSVRSALQANRSEQASPCGLRYVVVWSRPLSTSYAKVKNSCSPCLLLRPRTVVARHRPCVGLAVLFEVRPPTGEPDAGNPPVRFGGRGGPRSPYPYHFQSRVPQVRAVLFGANLGGRGKVKRPTSAQSPQRANPGFVGDPDKTGLIGWSTRWRCGALL